MLWIFFVQMVRQLYIIGPTRLIMLQVFPGENLELAIRKSGVSITEMAKRMRVDRRTFYNWFKKANVRKEIFLEAGFIIGRDFTKDFPGLIDDKANEVKHHRINKFQEKEVGLLSPSQDYWKLKYIDLLEKYNEVLMNANNAPSIIKMNNNQVCSAELPT